jgi:hypothetical protein
MASARQISWSFSGGSAKCIMSVSMKPGGRPELIVASQDDVSFSVFWKARAEVDGFSGSSLILIPEEAVTSYVRATACALFQTLKLAAIMKYRL